MCAVAVEKKKNFDFVDTIRCICMIGIVFEHSSVLWGNRFELLNDQLVQASVMQFFKFATIGFFLIGGFLINYKFTEYTPVQYVKNRFKNTIGPWAFWIIVLIALNVGQRYIVYWRFNEQSALPKSGYFLEQLNMIIFHSSFWFILNFLICIILLLIFKKYIYKLGFGLILALVSLFYSVNLYYNWFITEHSTALFGFVFYLWLGVYLNRYYDKVAVFIAKIPWWFLIAANALFFVLADAETIYLMHHGSNDAFNTLRVTNIIYSLGMFALMLKIGPIAKLQRGLKPRQTTFGVYLLHQILIIRLLPEIFKNAKFDISTMNIYESTVYTIVRFALVYLLSFVLVSLILKTKFKWSIGAK